MTPTFHPIFCRRLLAALVITLAAAGCQQQSATRIGFLVKMPEQAWFINEQRAAAEAGKAQGFEVINMGVPDGEKVMSAIDNLAAQGAVGFVICAPDVRLGPAIVARARAHNLKVVTVDDQLVDVAGKPIAGVPHLGMSAFKIGQQVGQTLAAEMRRRDWPTQEVAALRITDYELPTARLRTDGATGSLIEAGFDAHRIYDAPQRTTDTEGGFTAALPVLSGHPEVKHWLIYAVNEETVLGGVRATEQLKISASDVIGVGINGASEAYAEFSKSTATGFFATVAVSSTMHGRQTALQLIDWVRTGNSPPANTETTGRVMFRSNWQQVKQDLGL